MFYKDKIVLLDEKDDIFLVRAKKNQLNLDHYQMEKNVKHTVIQEDCNKDFDVSYDYLGNINIVYKNIENQLILTTLTNEGDHSIIIEELRSKIYYLNLIATDVLNIFYLEETGRRNILNIVHLIIEGDKVIRNIVDTIENYIIVSPIKIRKFNGNLVVFYYFKNIICVKMYDKENNLWEKSITLTDNRNKLYLDTTVISNEVHLAYSIFQNDQFYINYERFLVEDDYTIKEKEIKISDYGNHTEPILIRQKSKLFIVWRETNRLLSTFSDDNGNTWHETREFPETKKMDIVKYKYITKSNILSGEIDYSYGSTDPIKFIGF